MKKSFVLACFLLLAGSGFAQFTSATLQASGLTCAMCARSVHKNLESLSFVEKTDIDLNNSAFKLLFREGQSADVDAIRSKVEDAGFTVASLTLHGRFDQVKVQNNGHSTINGKYYHFLGVKDQVLQGEHDIRVVDKNFLSAKELKKFDAMTEMSCFPSGQAGNCCAMSDIPAKARIYHVTL